MKNKLPKLWPSFFIIFIIISNAHTQIPLSVITTDDTKNNCQGSYQLIDETEHDWSEYIALIYKNGYLDYAGATLNSLISSETPACAGDYKIEIWGPQDYDPTSGEYYSTGCFSGKSVSFTIKGECEIKTNPLVTGICSGEEDELKTITLDVDGGEEPYFISWSTGVYGNYMETMETGLYTVTVEDKNGCSITDNIIVDDNGSDFGYTYEVIPMTDGFYGELHVTFYNNYPPLKVQSYFTNTQIVNNGQSASYYFSPFPLNNDVEINVDLFVTNNSGCSESISINVPDCRQNSNEPFSVGNIFSTTNSEVKINNITGGLPPYNVEVKRIRKNNFEEDFTDWQSTTSYVDNSNITIAVPNDGKYSVIISDQCTNKESEEVYVGGQSCEFEISNSENDNTHYYLPRKGDAYKIVFEAICGCNDECSSLFGGKDPEIDIKNKNIPSWWGDVIITWPDIQGYENDNNSATTTYYWDGNSLEHTGKEQFSLGNYLDNKTVPEDLEVKVEITGIDCIIIVPITFSPSGEFTQLNFDQVEEFNGAWFYLLEFHDIWDDGYFKKSLLINSKCEDCYTSSEGVKINGTCGEENKYFVYQPNNFENPCNGGGTIETYSFDENNEISFQSIDIPPGSAFKEYKLDEMGSHYSWEVSSCSDGGGCLFSSENIFNFPLLNNDGEPYLVFASYCASGIDIIDDDGDQVHDDWDNCPNMSNSAQWDYDLDGIGDACDNCVQEYNPFQEDEDQDGKGDVCDWWDIEITITGTSGSSNINDSDSDGIIDINDNCINTPNFDQIDSDDNGIGDACDCEIITEMSFEGVCQDKMICPDEDPADIEGTEVQCVQFHSSSPNPFYGSSTIKWEVPAEGSANLQFYKADDGWALGDLLYSVPVPVQKGENSFLLLQQSHLNGYVGKIIRKLTYISGQFGSAQIYKNGLISLPGFKQNSSASESRNNKNKTFTANVYPNPASNSITVASQNEIYKIYIFSIDGRLAKEESILQTKTANLDLTDLESGLYIIKIMFSENNLFYKKIVIEK